MKHSRAVLATTVAAGLALAACAGQEERPSGEATADDPIVLTLGHSLSEDHVTSEAIESFAAAVEEDTDGRVVIDIFPNGQLGSELEVIEQVMVGIVDMTRVAAPGLASYEDGYHAFGLPFIFDDQDHFHEVMATAEMGDFFQASADEGFISLTYYTSGARSFYTRDTAVREPEDLAGLKIRVQEFRSQSEMMDLLDGTSIMMDLGDTYTELQTGIIDGAESNETVLNQSNHGEVANVFSHTEHTIIPDILVVSTETWDMLSPEDQDIITQAAEESTEQHLVDWDESIDEAFIESEEMGVEFITDVDRDAFQDATAPLVDEFADEFDGVAEVLDIVDAAREGQE